MVSAQNLQNRWSFNNGGVATASSGGTLTATDSIAGLTATLEGDAYFDGVTNVVLDGSYGTYVSLPGDLISSLTAVSVEGWVNSTVSGPSAHFFEFSDGTGTGTAYARYVIYGNNNSENQFELADFAGTTGDPNQSLVSGTGFGGVPLHVVCTYDPVAGVQSIYTNGILEALRVSPANQTPLNSVSNVEASLGQSPWFLNYGNSSDTYLAGTITEFRIWNAALNPLTVAALDASGPGIISTNYGTVTNVQLQVAFQMPEHGVQQAVVLASASKLAVTPNIATMATYKSGNTNILTVTATGMIDALAAGSAKITAIFGSVSNSQTITVSPPTASLSNRWSFYLPPAGSTTVTDSVQGVVATLNGDANLDGTNVNLDGTSGTFVSLAPDLINGITSLTCEAWVTTNAVSPDNVHVFEFSDGNGTGNAYYRYNLHNSGNANNFAELADVANGGNEKLGAAPGLGGSGPLHIVTIYDPVVQIQAIFTNGVLEGVQTGVTTALSGVSPNEASLGRSPWYAYGDPYLNGSISEFRIYSGELSPQQIAQDYQAGPRTLVTAPLGALQSIAVQAPPIMQPFTSQGFSVLVNYANLTNFNLTANNLFGTSVAGLTLASGNTNVISISNTVLTAVKPGTTTITAVYQGFTNSALVTVLNPPLAALLYRWSFNEPAGSLSVTDSVAGAVGFLEGDAALNGTGQVTLDGTSGTYVSLPGALLSGLQIVTIEAWVTNAVTPDNTCLFSFDDGVGDGVNGDGYLRYVIKENSNGHNLFELASSGGNSALTATPGLGGSSLHVVCIYDPVDGQQAVYTNGVLMASQGATVALSNVSAAAAALGRSPWWNYGDPSLAGTIDEFRIYSGRLLPGDIAAAQTIGPSVVLATNVSASVSRSGSGFTVTWPVASSGFTLEASLKLGAGAVWTPVSTAPSVVGLNNQVTLPVSNSTLFFRLVR
jgi:hypothetical protein